MCYLESLLRKQLCICCPVSENICAYQKYHILEKPQCMSHLKKVWCLSSLKHLVPVSFQKVSKIRDWVLMPCQSCRSYQGDHFQKALAPVPLSDQEALVPVLSQKTSSPIPSLKTLCLYHL